MGGKFIAVSRMVVPWSTWQQHVVIKKYSPCCLPMMPACTVEMGKACPRYIGRLTLVMLHRCSSYFGVVLDYLIKMIRGGRPSILQRGLVTLRQLFICSSIACLQTLLGMVGSSLFMAPRKEVITVCLPPCWNTKLKWMQQPKVGGRQFTSPHTKATGNA